MHFTIDRFAHSPEFGTFGRITCGEEKFFSVEQDWENNQPFLSCIPNGDYIAEVFDSPRHGKSLILCNESLNIAKFPTPNTTRDGCLMHVANKASQVEGCVAPGMKMGMLDDELAVLNSGTALKRIFEILEASGDTQHSITISSNFPSFVEE